MTPSKPDLAASAVPSSEAVRATDDECRRAYENRYHKVKALCPYDEWKAAWFSRKSGVTPEQFRAAAKAISDYRWILAAALSSTNIQNTKPSQKTMSDLSRLVDALLLEAKDGQQ